MSAAGAVTARVITTGGAGFQLYCFTSFYSDVGAEYRMQIMEASEVPITGVQRYERADDPAPFLGKGEVGRMARTIMISTQSGGAA
jgi:hypothetical protein